MLMFFRHIKDQEGVTLLIAVVLLAAFLSISLGILNILLGQIVIGISESESFHAFYSSDIGMERTLYRDRESNICGTTDCGTGGALINVPYSGCYQVVVDTSGSCTAVGRRCITVTGRYKCDGRERYVDRTFTLDY